MNALSPPPEPSTPAPPPIFGSGPVTYVVQPAPTPVRWRDRPLLWITLAALASCLIGFVAAPWFAYRALRSAARYDDPAALAQLVDYDAVRTSLRPQLVDPQGAPAAPPPHNPLTDPLGALKDAWTHRSWAPAVRAAPSPDAYLSPNALRMVLAGKAGPSRAPGPAPAGLATPWPSMVFFGLHRVRFIVHDPADPRRETVLVLARDRGWFDWRLVALTLPASRG